ncbi:MAG: hypothetical protein M3Q81_01185 [bacterium]|nr:hypothetical protein [bacterium]
METKSLKFLSQTTVIRVLLFFVVTLSLAAGYYYTLYSNENKKYLKLEDTYVRIRGQLGRTETQRLLDQSHNEPTVDW